MERLIEILEVDKKIPESYRSEKHINDIKKDLKIIFEKYNVKNPHLFNLRALLVPSPKKIVKLEMLPEKFDTGDLSIDDDSHSYIANGVPVHNTINLPNDYPIEDFDALYMKLWKEGGRGVTTYRDGTMMAVLETKKETKKDARAAKKEQKEFFEVWKDHERGEVIPHQVDLPSEYPMKGRKISSEGKKWYVSLSFKDKAMERPFAIFVSTNSREPDVIAHGTVEALTELAEAQGIALKHIEDNEKKCAGQTNVNKIARTISLLLRHNVKIEHIVKVLDNIDVPISSLVYRLKKLLMEYIFEMTNGAVCPLCDEKLVYTEGCVRCSACEYTRC